MDTEIVVCRRVEDCQMQMEQADCETCKKRVYVEGRYPGTKLCIHCAAQSHPDIVLFVELRPDEFGGRSMAKSLDEVFAADNGQWHKTGVWHNQRWVLDRQE